MAEPNQPKRKYPTRINRNGMASLVDLDLVYLQMFQEHTVVMTPIHRLLLLI